MLSHVSDVLMGGENGDALEIIIPEKHKKSLSDMPVRIVLLALAYHANKDSIAWPSAATLAKETRIAERRVRVAIKVLQENALIKRVAGYKPGKSGVKYLLTLPSFTDPDEIIETTSTHLVTHPQAQNMMQLSKHEVTPPCTQPMTPACDKEEVKVKHKEKEEILLTFELATDLFQAFWDCYPRKSSPDKKARAEWNFVIEKVGLSSVVNALIQLLSVPRQDGEGYQPAHEWLADLVEKS